MLKKILRRIFKKSGEEIFYITDLEVVLEELKLDEDIVILVEQYYEDVHGISNCAHFTCKELKIIANKEYFSDRLQRLAKILKTNLKQIIKRLRAIKDEMLDDCIDGGNNSSGDGSGGTGRRIRTIKRKNTKSTSKIVRHKKHKKIMPVTNNASAVVIANEDNTLEQEFVSEEYDDCDEDELGLVTDGIGNTSDTLVKLLDKKRREKNAKALMNKQKAREQQRRTSVEIQDGFDDIANKDKEKNNGLSL